MAGPGPILKECHRLLELVRDLDQRIANSPRQLQVQKTKVAAAEENLKKAHDEINGLKVKIRDREASIKSTFAQIAKWEKQRESSDNKKEYDAFGAEIVQAQGRIGAFEEEVLVTMGELEEKIAQLPTVEQATQVVRNEAAHFEKEYQERVERFRSERARAAEALTKSEAEVPPEIKPIYSKIVGAKGADALSGLEGRTCVACYTELTPQNFNDVNRGAFLMCKSCGRILYA